MITPVEPFNNSSVSETLSDILKRAADLYGNSIAVIDRNKGISYKTIFSHCTQFAILLQKIGLKKGDRVCINLSKDINQVIALFGTWLSGGVAIPLQPQIRPFQIHHILKDSFANIFVTTSSNYDVFFKNSINHDSLRIVIFSSQNDCYDDDKRIIAFDPQPNSHSTFGEYILPSNHERDLAAILYTSGSTGKPKGVVLSHYNIVSGTKNVAKYLKISSSDRILGLLNFSFDYGLNQLTTAFFCGAQIVLYDYMFVKGLVNVIKRHKITGVAAVSTTWIQLAKSCVSFSDLTCLRYITNSGGSIPSIVVRELRKHLPSTAIYLMYGFTEAFRSTFLDPDLIDQYPDSIGKAVPGQEIYVLDKNNHHVKCGEIGELVHRGSHVALGYWNNPKESSKVFRPNPFLPKAVYNLEIVAYSGDMVKIDENGFLFYIGRNDAMIKSSGYRISPTEIEECIYGFPGVAEAVAMGLPHPELGQIIAVIVIPSSGSSFTSEDIKLHCVNHLPPYMVPKAIAIWDQLFYNSNNKPDRPKIRNYLLSLNNDYQKQF